MLLICVTLTTCMPRAERIEYSVENATSEEFTEATIVIGKNHQFKLGVIIPSSAKSFGGQFPTDPENPTSLTWTTIDGKGETLNFTLTRAELTDERQIRIVINTDGSITKEWRFP